MATNTHPPLETPPQNWIYDSSFQSDKAFLVAMCRCTRFHIEVYLDDLGVTPFAETYKGLISGLSAETLAFENWEDEELLRDWMLEPVLPYFRAVPELEEEVTLEMYFNSPIKHLRLGVENGELKAKRIFGEKFELDNPWRQPLPVFPIKDIPAFENVPRIQASTIVSLSEGTHFDPASNLPASVRLQDGTVKRFDHPFSNIDLVRKLGVASTMLDRGLYEKALVEKLHAIAVSDDGEMAYGLLFDSLLGNSRLGPGRTILHPDFWMPNPSPAQKGKWGAQVQATLQILHQNGIVWGEVLPQNVMVDDNDNAYVTGFGESWSIDYVDWDKFQTFEGDWQGFRNIFLKRLEGKKWNVDAGSYGPAMRSQVDEDSDCGSVRSERLD